MERYEETRLLRGRELDGFIADPNGGFDAFLVEGEHAEVVFGEYADALPTHVLSALRLQPPRTKFDTVIMGWNTITPALEAGISSPYPHLRQVVASRQPRSISPDITVTDDPVATVQRLKREDGLGIWLCGGGELAGALLPEIDQLVLKRNPVVLGSGIGLFGARACQPTNFQLNSARAFASGVVVEEYVRG